MTRVFVAGGTGFIGRHVLSRLGELDGVDVIAHARPGSRSKLPDVGLTVVQFDLNDRAALDDAMAGCDVVVQLIGMPLKRYCQGESFDSVDVVTTQQLVAAARRVAGASPRFVHLSSYGAHPRRRMPLVFPPAYFRAKHRAERVVRRSGLHWTIARPSFVTGEDIHVAERAAAAIVGAVSRALEALNVSAAVDFAPIRVEALAKALADAAITPRLYETLQGQGLRPTSR